MADPAAGLKAKASADCLEGLPINLEEAEIMLIERALDSITVADC